jgi:hypothetical protein
MVSPASLVLRDIATNPASGRAFGAIVEKLKTRAVHLTDLHASDIQLLRDSARHTKKPATRRRKIVAAARFSIKKMRKAIELKRHPKPKSEGRVHTCLTAQQQLQAAYDARCAGRAVPVAEPCDLCEHEKQRKLVSFCLAFEV